MQIQHSKATLDPRSKQETLQMISRIRSLPTVRQKMQLKTRCGLRDTPNSLLELSVDLHRCNTIKYVAYYFPYV